MGPPDAQLWLWASHTSPGGMSLGPGWLRGEQPRGTLTCLLPQWKSGQLVQLGWTASEDLLCIQDDGTVLIYNLFCEFKRHFSMGNEVLQNHVLEAKVFHTEYGTGVAILTGAHRFSLATNIDDLKLRRMPEVPGLQKPPSCWAVLSQDRVTIVLLAVGQELYLLDNTSCSVVVSELRQPALAGASRAICTPPSSLEKFCEFTSSVRSPPKQMVWCLRPRSRQRAVVVAWDRQLMVVGNSTECIQFVLDEDSYLVPELDGVRILSRTSHEFLHEIPEASQEIFKIASMAPGALLLEAQKEYEKESQKADEYLREIKDQKLLPEAVSQCIEAAGYEHEPDTQKSLLRAASFGKCFIDKFPPESFVRMCQDLRVLNAIRDYQIGIPLTFTQYPLCRDPAAGVGSGPGGIGVVGGLAAPEVERRGCPVPAAWQRCWQGGEVAALCPQRIEGRVGALQNALDEYYKAKNEFAAKATEDQIKLLRLQRHLQEDFDKPYLDLSLHDTVSNLILDGHHKRAEQLYREFKIPDKRYWWLKISALANRGDWEELEKFSKSKKSPIGYLVRAFLAGGGGQPCPRVGLWGWARPWALPGAAHTG
uniref:Vacuolar protein sorting-associated protein 16 homolog n=1 Tax=Athene cunicularia TaxID=194338 RepID=A0A663NFC1_ATHCN